MSIQITVMLMRKQNDQPVSVETAEMARRLIRIAQVSGGTAMPPVRVIWL